VWDSQHAAIHAPEHHLVESLNNLGMIYEVDFLLVELTGLLWSGVQPFVASRPL
jgi:hypothetical protein